MDWLDDYREGDISLRQTAYNLQEDEEGTVPHHLQANLKHKQENLWAYKFQRPVMSPTR